MNEARGVVYLVGAGPGDPGLLTVRGRDLLTRADVVVYDHLADSRLLELAPASAIRICAGKSSGHCVLNQDQINDLLLEHARAGRAVVRLKGGDPLIFGRGAEEAEFLTRNGVPFRLVPGVTAGVGVTAYAGIPVTHRDLSSAVAFVTGHSNPESVPDPVQNPDPASATRAPSLDWQALARFPGTLVVYMGVTHLAAICRTLIKEGKDGQTTAAVIVRGTGPLQKVVEGTLATIAEKARQAPISPPALLVVGPVVARRSVISWYESLPLFGQRIVVTRPADEGARSVAVLEELGAEVLLAPTVEIRPISDTGPLDAAIRGLDSYNWLVFTSGNGVSHFLRRLSELGYDLRALGHLKLAAIGPGTARVLTAHHLRADLIPETYRSEALAEALAPQVRGCRVLLARADRGRPVLKQELSGLADVDQVPVYQNADVMKLPAEVLARMEAGTVDWITLTSSAIAARLHALLPDETRAQIGPGKQTRLASLSPVTTEAAKDLGWQVSAEAVEYTWEGLIQAMMERVLAVRD